VRDLFAAYSASLGNPVNVGTQALVLAAAEAVAIAELTRPNHLAGSADLNSVVRAEGTAARALRRLGLDRAVAPPRKSFTDRLVEMEAARQVAGAQPAADAAEDARQRPTPINAPADPLRKPTRPRDDDLANRPGPDQAARPPAQHQTRRGRSCGAGIISALTFPSGLRWIDDNSRPIFGVNTIGFDQSSKMQKSHRASSRILCH